MQYRNIKVRDMTMRWQEAGEGALDSGGAEYLRREGAGAHVVLVHGIPTCPRLWRHVAPLVPGARILAWEMMRYGASIAQGRGRALGIAQQAEYLTQWMEAIGVDRAILVGHDLGGGVVQNVAVRYPERVQALVLVNSICYDSWPIFSIKLMRALWPIMNWLPRPAFRMIFRIILQRGHETPERATEAMKEHWSHYSTADGAAAFIRQVRALDVNDTLSIADRLPALGIPARIVWGAADRFQKIEYGERLAADLRAPIDRTETARHFVPEDHPERVAAAINALLSQIPSASETPPSNKLRARAPALIYA
jgi:pimeloyl-ACP methyl ester carboxylesterase